ncbi:MAG: DNA recombination protein RmuC [Candidatus Omnitrophica bacterium]|nr:DNA recombination protein RmuC [Candidatus Omnitrophota bacterium]
MLNIAVLVLLFGMFVYLVVNNFKNQKNFHPEALGLMQQQLENLRGQVNESMRDMNSNIDQKLQSITQQLFYSQQSVGERLDSATQVFGQVQKNLGSLSAATERVFEVGKDIASLQEILKSPKIRGGLGELFLGDLLNQVLPASFVKQQYKFKNGDIVDAVLSLGQGLVSIDSKFPLENFKRLITGINEEEKRQARKIFVSDVKKHIDSIASKYILPDEGTFDFALMYIPAENVYYEIIIKDDADEKNCLSAYALSKKVIPVSPNSFYAYLQSILLGLKGLSIDKNAHQIIQYLERLKGDMEKFKQDFEVLGRHIVNLKNKYDEADKKINTFEGKLLTICQIEPESKIADNDSKY